MKKLIIVTGTLLVFLFIAIAVFLYSSIGNDKRVKTFILSQESILGLFFEDETLYSRGFATENWNKIGIEDNVDTVVQLIGVPLDQNVGADGKQYWFYSKQSPKNTNYRVRIIVFDSNNKVEKIIKEFYLD